MANSIVQMLLEPQQVCYHYHFLWEPVPVPKHHLSEETFLNTQPEPPLTQLHAVPSGPIAITRDNRSAPVSIFSFPSLYIQPGLKFQWQFFFYDYKEKKKGAKLLLATCMTLWWQKQFHLSLYIAFSTKVDTRLEIIMEITKKKNLETGILKGWHSFSKIFVN